MILKVGHASIKVRPLDPEGYRTNAIYGFYSPSNHTIYVDADQPPVRQARILLHEAVHAFFDTYRLTTESLDEEGVCEALDGPLTALLIDNPWLAPVVQNCAAGVPLPLS